MFVQVTAKNVRGVFFETQCRSHSYIKVIGSRLRSQEQKAGYTSVIINTHMQIHIVLNRLCTFIIGCLSTGHCVAYGNALIEVTIGGHSTRPTPSLSAGLS